MSHADLPLSTAPRLNPILPIACVILLWAGIEAAFVFGGITPILRGDFPDGDGFQRLLRIMHLLDSGDWYDGTLPRSNWPFGETMNWTRPLDILLLAGAGLLRPFMSLPDGLYWFGIVQAPLFALAAAFAAGWAAKPFFGERPSYALTLLFLMQPGVLSYTDAGRVDHHGLQIFCFVLACGFAARALAQPEKWRAAVLAGGVMALGLWISTEFLLILAASLATFGLMWLYQGERWVPANRGLATGFALGVAIALPLERAPMAGLFVVELDRLSILHLALAVVILAAWLLLPLAARKPGCTPIRRLGVAALGLLVGAAIMGSIDPRFFAGPLAAVDPALVPIWFSHIAEWQPVLPTSQAGVGRLLFWLGPPLLGFAWSLGALWHHRRDSLAPNWLFTVLTLGLFIVLTMRGVRFARYAEIASLVPLFRMVIWVCRRLGERQFVGATVLTSLAVTAIILGLPYCGLALMGAAAANDHAAKTYACRIAEIAPVLSDPNGLGRRQHVIVAHLDSGPEIMYRTPHAVIGTPMHRNAAGILATYRLFTAPDDATARSIIDSRGIDLILLCPRSGERPFYASGNNEDTFYNRLVDDRLPVWVKRLALPAPLEKGFRLYAICPDMVSQTGCPN
jgi:hypothetical protein